MSGQLQSDCSEEGASSHAAEDEATVPNVTGMTGGVIHGGFAVAENRGTINYSNVVHVCGASTSTELAWQLDVTPNSRPKMKYVVLAFQKKNEETAYTIQEEMEKIEHDGRHLDVRLMNDVECFGPLRTIRPHKISESALVVFYIHDGDCDNNGKHNIYSDLFDKDQLIAEIRDMKRETGLIPLHTKPSINSPVGMTDIAPLEWFNEAKRKQNVLDIINHCKKDRETMQSTIPTAASEERNTLETDAVPDGPVSKSTSATAVGVPVESEQESASGTKAPESSKSSDEEDNDQFDVVLAFLKKNEKRAREIKEDMENLQYKGKSLDLKVGLMNDPCFGPSIVERPSKAADSALLLFYIHAADDDKDLDKPYFEREELVGEVRLRRNQRNLLPLHEKENLDRPKGFADMQELEWFNKKRRSQQLNGMIRYERKTRKEENRKTGVPRYPLRKDHIGLSIIVNNWEFDQTKYDRHSSQHLHGLDLKDLFNSLNFKVLSYENVTKARIDEIKDRVVSLIERNPDKYDSMVWYLTSHGVYDEILTKDCQTISVRDLASSFRPSKCEALKTKPKLFFVDACRGIPKDPLTGGTSVDIDSVGESDVSEIEHFFFGYSTQPGQESHKNPETGSVYTDEFIKTMKILAESEDLNSIMVDVTRRVSDRKMRLRQRDFQALPDPVSKLKYKMFFTPGE